MWIKMETSEVREQKLKDSQQRTWTAAFIDFSWGISYFMYPLTNFHYSVFLSHVLFPLPKWISNDNSSSNSRGQQDSHRLSLEALISATFAQAQSRRDGREQPRLVKRPSENSVTHCTRRDTSCWSSATLSSASRSSIWVGESCDKAWVHFPFSLYCVLFAMQTRELKFSQWILNLR